MLLLYFENTKLVFFFFITNNDSLVRRFIFVPIKNKMNCKMPGIPRNLIITRLNSNQFQWVHKKISQQGDVQFFPKKPMMKEYFSIPLTSSVANMVAAFRSLIKWSSRWVSEGNWAIYSANKINKSWSTLRFIELGQTRRLVRVFEKFLLIGILGQR